MSEDRTRKPDTQNEVASRRQFLQRSGKAAWVAPTVTVMLAAAGRPKKAMAEYTVDPE